MSNVLRFTATVEANQWPHRWSRILNATKHHSYAIEQGRGMNIVWTPSDEKMDPDFVPVGKYRVESFSWRRAGRGRTMLKVAVRFTAYLSGSARPEASDRAKQAAAMREAGAKYTEIADRMGVSRERARQLAQRGGESA